MDKTRPDKIIWIDQFIDNEENNYTFQEFKYNLPKFTIYKAASVKKAFEIISEKYNEFKFKLFYVIVSGRLSEEFFNEYLKKSLEMHILASTIIYCSEKYIKTC